VPSTEAIADPHQSKDEQGYRGFPGGFHSAPPLILRVRETRRPYSNSSSSAMGLCSNAPVRPPRSVLCASPQPSAAVPSIS
jgi:hypothetical protein